ESTTDLAWDGQTFVYECGDLLGQSERFPRELASTVVDVDLDRMVAERRRQNTFEDNRRTHAESVAAFRTHRTQLHVAVRPTTGPLQRPLHRFPFVPDDPARLAQDCYEAYNIQVAGLVRRLEAIGGDRPGGTRPVIGVSGGLDSTQALIV